jgi:hypothetical protein
VWWNGDTAPPLLTSAQDGIEWSASCAGRFISEKKTAGTHWKKCWVGTKSGLDVMEKRNISSFCRESNSDLEDHKITHKKEPAMFNLQRKTYATYFTLPLSC